MANGAKISKGATATRYGKALERTDHHGVAAVFACSTADCIILTPCSFRDDELEHFFHVAFERVEDILSGKKGGSRRRNADVHNHHVAS